MLSLLVVALLFISPTGVQPGRKCKELEQWGWIGTVAIGKQMLPSGRGARWVLSSICSLLFGLLGLPDTTFQQKPEIGIFLWNLTLNDGNSLKN